ncbi:MAG TPA: DUF2071 domain-containing protein [Methylomirabilota bacterium]|nr:DUF2071 domain-containing protein [Methylomirabilota bacterium]
MRPPRSGPWIMVQRWERLLFAHWPLAAERLGPLLPRGLTLETFEARAWLGITPFTLSVLRPRGLPSPPGLAPFPELNVRTYVRVGDRPGVFFFSLDAGSALAVAGARAMYSLPYFWARCHAMLDGAWVIHESRRRRAPHPELRVRYRATGPVQLSAPGTLAHWLTERYCLYAVTRRGALWRADIDHRPWPLQPAEAEILANTMTHPLGLDCLDGAPVLHVAEALDVRVGPPRRVGSPAPGV